MELNHRQARQKRLKRQKSDTADSIFGQKSGPALAGPAGPATTALHVFSIMLAILSGPWAFAVLMPRRSFSTPSVCEEVILVVWLSSWCQGVAGHHHVKRQTEIAQPVSVPFQNCAGK